MGFFDSILKEQNDDMRQEGKNIPFAINISFSPVRLAAMHDNKVNMIIRIKNLTGENQLVSVDGAVSTKGLIGFDPTCLSKRIEKKVGEVKPGETAEVIMQLWASNQTKEAIYPVQIIAYSHYINYDKVIKTQKKMTHLRVV